MKKFLCVFALFLVLTPALSFAETSDEQKLDKAWELYNLGKYKQVISIVTPLATRGNPRAQLILGDCYEMGLGIGEAPEIAVQWFQLAAEKGNAQAMAKMGYAYAVGNGVPKNFQLAVQWMANAAERGDPGAIETLAIWNQEGKLN